VRIIEPSAAGLVKHGQTLRASRHREIAQPQSFVKDRHARPAPSDGFVKDKMSAQIVCIGTAVDVARLHDRLNL
jgi:hypothetical protein